MGKVQTQSNRLGSNVKMNAVKERGRGGGMRRMETGKNRLTILHIVNDGPWDNARGELKLRHYNEEATQLGVESRGLMSRKSLSGRGRQLSEGNRPK